MNIVKVALQKKIIETSAPLLSTQLIESLKNGDRFAMEEIYRHYWAEVLDSAYKRVRDEEVAQDITQEVFISLWENRDRLVIQDSMRAYLEGAVKYKVINYFRSTTVKEKHKQDLELLMAEKMEVSAENKLMLKDLNNEIDAAIQLLPEKMRQIFWMSRKQEKTITEISVELNLSAQTVKNQISAALKTLKKRLSYLLFVALMILFL